jgi:hypothetical protein
MVLHRQTLQNTTAKGTAFAEQHEPQTSNSGVLRWHSQQHKHHYGTAIGEQSE